MEIIKLHIMKENIHHETDRSIYPKNPSVTSLSSMVFIAPLRLKNEIVCHGILLKVVVLCYYLPLFKP